MLALILAVAMVIVLAYPTVALAAEDTTKRGVQDKSTEVPDDSVRPREDVPDVPLPNNLVSPITSAREYFAAYGIDFGTLRLLVDSRPFDVEEEDPLLKILAQLPRIADDEFRAWQKKEVTTEQFQKDASSLRAEAIHLQGRVRRIVKKSLPEKTVEKYQVDHHYEVEMELKDGAPATIFTRDIPVAWEKSLLEKPLNQRVSLWGVYLKFGAPAADGKTPPRLFFAAKRLAWHPTSGDPAMEVSPSLQLLGDLDVDASLLHFLADQQPLRAEERESFYQVLSAASRAEPKRLLELASARKSLAPLLAQPHEQRGQLVSVKGLVRRATKIMIDDADLQQRFGIDHYYELVVFVPERIRYRYGQQGPEILHDTFPVVCCVAKLPPEIPMDQDVAEQIAVSGFYFKLYSYASQFMQQQLQERNLPGELRQHSPLIIAPSVVVIPRAKAEEGSFSGPLAFFVVTIVVVGAVWGFSALRGSTSAEMRPASRITPPEGHEEKPVEGMPQIKSKPPTL